MVVPSELEDTGVSNDDDVENIGLGCALENFTEWKEVLSMINDLKVPQDEHSAELVYEKFRYIIYQYTEQPHLLDPHLDDMLNDILNVVKSQLVDMTIRHRAFKYMCAVISVRGYKVVLRHLPHEVSDVELVLHVLEAQDATDTATWETRYCLTLWLSIVVMIPFDMARLDCGGAKCPTVTRLLHVCKTYLMVGDKCRDAAAYLSAKLFTRSDIKKDHLSGFLNWITDQCTEDKRGDWKRFGPLASLAAILKHGEREDLLPHADRLLAAILDSKCRNDPYRLTRKFAIKIIQRIGLTFLKVRVAAWRYSRGSRLLALNLTSGSSGKSPGGDVVNDASIESNVENEEYDVPRQVEEVIEELVQGLCDADITIRWSAAKGIGRITARLNKEMGDEVVGSILDLLSPRECDAAWHGGCLALAELGKRGLLLPSRLPEVVPRVSKALTYDEPRGYSSVGSHIRDAACYVCWSFARAYDKEDIKPFVDQIANSLLIVTCFDREIHCRRAASAAFQENVGRQGAFPHGIDILTTADYFSVGPRNNAFLNISNFIADFDEYKHSLVKHLLERKVDHWDMAIRDLTGKAFHKLTAKAPELITSDILAVLIQEVNSINSNARHGAVICIGEIVHALSILNIAIAPDIADAIKNLVNNYQKRNYFIGVSGELMKLACCFMIQKCSIAKFQLGDDEDKVVGAWQWLIDDCLTHEVSNIRTQAANALSELCKQYYQKDGSVVADKQTAVIEKYTNQLAANNYTVRMGHALAIGHLPAFMVQGYVRNVITCLIKCSKITEESTKWAESRRDAIKAITAVCDTVGLEVEDDNYSCRQHVNPIVECFLEGLRDYTLDSRGDVGSWVREASISGLMSFIPYLVKTDKTLLSQDLVTRAITGICQQAIERIDRTRALAGKAFSELLHNVPTVPYIPHRDELLEILPESVCSKMDWSAEVDTFPLFVKLLNLPAYTYNVMLGFIVSVGGLTESLVKYSSNSMFEHFKSQTEDELLRFGSVIIRIFEEYQFVDRVMLPMMTFLDRLFNSFTFSKVLMNEESEFAMKIFTLTKTEVTKCNNVNKLTSSVDVFCQLIQVSGEVRRKALGQLSIFLCHRFMWLRQQTATKLYESLMVYGDDCDLTEEKLDEATTILSESEWNTWPIEKARDARNSLCQIFNIQAPKLIPVKKTAPVKTLDTTG